jgi:hypothetical protein
MVFRTSTSGHGAYFDNDYMWMDANNSFTLGYDDTTTHSNETKITASDAAASDFFGSSVAVGSGRVVVGVPFDDDAGTSSGSAYIFDLDGTQIAKITAPSGAGASDNFGYSVAVGSDRIVVGAKNADDGPFNGGSAFIFDLDGNIIDTIFDYDYKSNASFGSAVAVGSGRIVVGAINHQGPNTGDYSAGAAFIYRLNTPDSRNQSKTIKASDAWASDNFGCSVAVGSGRIVVGALNNDDVPSSSGSAYIFDLDGNELTKITASDAASGDQFGCSVAVGNGRIVVGAQGNDDDGGGSGSAYVYDLEGNLITKITASDAATGDAFGASVAVGSGRIVVGAAYNDDNGSSSGSAYIFDLDGTQLAKITAGDAAAGDEFGAAVAVGSGKIVIAARYNDDNGTDSGSAYIYDIPLNSKHILDI